VVYSVMFVGCLTFVMQVQPATWSVTNNVNSFFLRRRLVSYRYSSCCCSCRVDLFRL